MDFHYSALGYINTGDNFCNIVSVQIQESGNKFIVQYVKMG